MRPFPEKLSLTPADCGANKDNAVSEYLKSPEEIWPLLEGRYLAHGWQGRLFGLKHWLKGGHAGSFPEKDFNVVAVRDAGKGAEGIEKLKDDGCGIILVERASPGGEMPRANPHADIHLLLEAEAPLLTVRNIGAGASDCDTIVFMAGDGLPESGFLQAYREAFASFPGTLACRGQIISRYLDEPAAVTGSFRLPENIEFWPVDLEENMAVKSDVFFKLGGFDEAMLPGYGALDMSIRLFGIQPDFFLQRHVPGAKLAWEDSSPDGLPFADYLSVRQRSWLELNETMKTYLSLYARFWQERAACRQEKIVDA